MPQLEKILPLIDGLTSEERGLLLSALQQPAQEDPLIITTRGVCGGAARLIRTRIPVWVLERMRQLGVSDREMLRSYPALRDVDVFHALAYAARNPAEIEKAIRENEED